MVFSYDSGKIQPIYSPVHFKRYVSKLAPILLGGVTHSLAIDVREFCWANANNIAILFMTTLHVSYESPRQNIVISAKTGNFSMERSRIMAKRMEEFGVNN